MGTEYVPVEGVGRRDEAGTEWFMHPNHPETGRFWFAQDSKGRRMVRDNVKHSVRYTMPTVEEPVYSPWVDPPPEKG